MVNFQEVSDEYLDEMMNQAPGAINFTMFLTLFGERLQVITQGNFKNDVTQWGWGWGQTFVTLGKEMLSRAIFE